MNVALVRTHTHTGGGRLRRASFPALALALVAAAACAVSGCGREEKNRAGFGLLPPSVLEEGEMRDTTFVGAVFAGLPADSAETDFPLTYAVDPAGAGDRLTVAAEAGMRARALVHFAALPDSGAVLTSVAVRLTVLAAAPSSPLPRIEAFELVQPFGESLTGNQSFPGYVAEPIGEGVSTEAQGDTAATYVFSGPAFVTVFQRWVNREHVNGGLLFAPAPGESGRVECYPREAVLLASDPRPLLTLVRDEGGVPDTTRAVPDRDTFVAERTGPSLAGEPERLTIAGGVPVRSLLRFDIIPTLEHGLIHRAVLTLSVDSAASRFDSLVVVGEQVVDYPWEGEDTRANREVAARATAYAGVDTVALDLTTLARQWTLAAGENRGVRLRLSAEVTRLDWVRFYSSAVADSTRRPRLHVTYSPAPEVGG